MPASWIVEAVDIFEDGHLGVATCAPGPLPDQLRLDGFEDRFHRRVVVGTVLAATVGVMDAAPRRSPQRNGHVQGPDRQVTFHPVADGPDNHAP